MLARKVDPLMDFNRKQGVSNILVGITGSVASIKCEQVVRKLQSSRTKSSKSLEVRVVATECALKFIDRDSIPAFVYDDRVEWSSWRSRGDPVVHIELRKWADIFVIAPVDANTLAKLANGLCDNILTCIARAWDVSKPLVFCPAMNTMMFTHPLTNKHREALKSFGYIEIEAVEKTLMCKDTGIGAMAEVETIVEAVVDLL